MTTKNSPQPTRHRPRYPIYIPSKGRFENCLTAKFMVKDQVDFYLVVEPQEQDEYGKRFGADRLLVLPFSNQGLIAARNWIKAHATAAGHLRHWQFDDNIRRVWRSNRGRRNPVNANVALAATEDFVDRYENIAIAGLNYEMFGFGDHPPFRVNVHVYSCSLILNALPQTWRDKYNDDTDICLQVLAAGWCTVLVQAFLVEKMRTMVMSGGNTTDLYQADGRLRMANALTRRWPGVVETKRRFGRPQHVIKYAWKKFDTPLKLKEGITLEDFQQNEYGMKLKPATARERPVRKFHKRKG